MVCSHQKPAPIPVQILYGPAKIALEAMLFLRIASPSLLGWTPSENLSQDARMLLDLWYCSNASADDLAF
ncbi:hypothetical protein N7486_004307 [Penicillium sp. IBT 16267x]|nr:hypothetical protein N7486_004307 [Penicillium sp. IBT 16267x]